MGEAAETLAEIRQPAENLPTVTTKGQNAVCVRKAHKAYGDNVVLDGLNMTVAKGCIYGLLGASGCGKTTLLSCIVGRRNLRSGEIWVLGGRPGTRESGAPGPRIGYMPQETALFGEISIRETMIYFGWIAGMTTAEVDERLHYLIKLLQLPSADSTVKNLSGGQQRRVSLSAALLHSPELLILDEPTVGVDPMLRQSIWDHMKDITKETQTTVIITTHYIEESRQAHMKLWIQLFIAVFHVIIIKQVPDDDILVDKYALKFQKENHRVIGIIGGTFLTRLPKNLRIGLMRGGIFLAEQSPSSLLERYNAASLEQVFLELAVKQNRSKKNKSTSLQEVTGDQQKSENAPVDVEENEKEGRSVEYGDRVSVAYREGAIEFPDTLHPVDAPVSWVDKIKPVKFRHMKAIVWKNFLSLIRNCGVMMFLIGLPISQILLFCISIGHNPVGLKIGIVNYELDPDKMLEPCFEDFTEGCNSTRLSCKYLKYLQDRTGNFIPYESREEALHEINRGELSAVVIFRQNFSTSLEVRLHKRHETPADAANNSNIEVHRGGTNGQVDFLIMNDFLDSYVEFSRKLAKVCGFNEVAYQAPIMINKPIYGDVGTEFTDSAAPGVILTIIFFLALASTAISMLTEKSEGILERSLVSGITGPEILFSHVVTQLIVMCIQNALVLVFGFLVYGLTCRGELILVIFLTLLTGLCGMTFGFVISSLCDKERTATYLAMGSFLPMIMMCGIIWPVEGMHVVLQYISFILPLTKSTESLRSIMERGLGLEYHVVSDGFVSTGIWIAIYLSTSLLLIKFKKA